MKVHEADISDKMRWDSFVDTENGDFGLYLGWKYIYESRGDRYIPFMVEDDSSQILGILPLVKEKKFLYSTLESLPEGAGGFLLKKELSEPEKYEVIRTLIEQVDRYYSKGCSRLSIRKSLRYVSGCTDPDDIHDELPERALTDSGLKYNYNEITGFPCTHVLELKQPFDEQIWKDMWSHTLRKQIDKAVRNGVSVIEDQEFRYQDIFIDMLIANYRRRGNKRDIKDETKAKFDIFRDKTKLFIALQDSQPIFGLLCHHTRDTWQMAKQGSYDIKTDNASKLCIKTAIEYACNAGYKFAEFGMSTDRNVVKFKSLFKFAILPFGDYRKTYSVLRNRIHQTSQLLGVLQGDKMYLWNNRKKLLKKLVNVRE